MKRLILFLAFLLYAPLAFAAAGDLTATFGDRNSSNVHRVVADNNGVVTFAQDTGIKLPYTSGSTAETLTASQTGVTYVRTNGAGAAVDGAIYTLPTAAVGMEYTFVTDVAKIMEIDPQSSDTIQYASTSAGYRIRNTTAAAGDSITLFCAVANSWSVKTAKGTWAISTYQN